MLENFNDQNIEDSEHRPEDQGLQKPMFVWDICIGEIRQASRGLQE
jgi:hypothetical protein